MENLPTHGPAFCKIIMGDFITKLRIPPAFAEKYGQFLSEKVTLETDQSGNSWNVEIEKIDGDHWLTHGWHEFLKANRLKFPDFVVFRFVKDSKIRVTIFDKNGCKKDAPFHISEQANPSRRTRRCSETNASSSAEVSKNTKLIFTWKNFMRRHMTFRKSITEEIGLAEESTVKIKSLEGHIYEVRLTKKVDGRVGMSGGWTAFVAANNFVLNKTYQFEFIRSCNNELLLQLSLVED